MKHKLLKRIGAMALSLGLAVSMMSVGVSATNEANATIDTGKTTSLTLYKYDITGAESDGVWETESYVSTGIYDETVNEALNPYAIQGVEFSYLKLADLDILKENEGAEHKIMPLYGFHEDVNSNSKATVDFLAAIGLTTNDAYTVKHDSNQNRIWYFQSDTLIDALAAAFEQNATATKAALETYMAKNKGTALPETDKNGKTGAENISQGLYLVVETKVPENVTSTTAPFLVSLPMTTVDGDQWNYSVTVYPKNETGNPTLDKYVRENKSDTGKNNGTTNDMSDGYAHTATASDGDEVDYQVISTLPTITSPATALTTYTFVDTLSKGIQYNDSMGDCDVKIEFFTDSTCENLVATWTAESGKFTVNYKDYDPENGSVMTIKMTDTVSFLPRGRERKGQMEQYRVVIQKNTSYITLLQEYPYQQEQLAEILELLTETVCTTRKTIRVAGNDFPTEVVKARLLKLTAEHIRFVLGCISRNTTKIRNIKQYLLTALYNAPITIDNYYAAMVSHDLARKEHLC